MASTMRWQVVTRLATGAGGPAFTRDRSGARTSMARRQPSFFGMSLPIVAMATYMTLLRVISIVAFTGPAGCGDVPAKSTSSASPRRVTATSMRSGSSVMPSSST